MPAKLSSHENTVDLFGLNLERFHQSQAAGENSALAQLNLTDIVLSQEQPVFLREHNTPLSRSVRAGARVAGGNTPAFPDQSALRRLTHRVQEAAAAQPAGRAAANDSKHCLRTAKQHTIHSAGGGPHSAADVHALQRRPGRACTGGHPAFPAEDHFSIGSDVQKEDGVLRCVQTGGKSPGHNIAADIGRDRGGAPDMGRRMEL